ncbi:MAG: response regulator [Candidatus Omnitrophota bacterium]
MADPIKIALIDDEADLGFLVKSNLEETGKFSVSTLSESEKAEEFCKSENPDIILMDIVMPKRNGVEVASLLKKDPDTAKIPIILVSGLGEMVYQKKQNKWSWMPNRPVVQNRGNIVREKDPDRAMAIYGVDGYLSKPFNTETLVALIEETLAKKKLRESEEGSQSE